VNCTMYELERRAVKFKGYDERDIDKQVISLAEGWMQWLLT
jgi:hypothetical protein